MAHDSSNPHASTWDWSSGNTSSSADVTLNMLELVGLIAPAFETNTAYLLPQVSKDSFDTADASATFVDVYDKDGTQVKLAVGTAARRVKLTLDDVGLLHGRVRFKAVQSDGSTGVTQVAQSVSPILKSA